MVALTSGKPWVVAPVEDETQRRIRRTATSWRWLWIGYNVAMTLAAAVAVIRVPAHWGNFWDRVLMALVFLIFINSWFVMALLADWYWSAFFRPLGTWFRVSLVAALLAFYMWFVF